MNFFSIISFIAIVAAIWIFAYKKSRSVNTDSSEGFFLGGRSLTGLTIGGTIIMVNQSTEQIIGQNGQSYVSGMEVMAWDVTAAFAIILLALVFLPKYIKSGVNTVTDFIEVRYDTTTKRIMSALFMFTYMTSLLPVVLYSGALAFNRIFHINEILNINPLTSIVIISIVVGTIGLLYLLMGGLRLGAFSDSIYGIGLILGGFVILILGLTVLGDGSFIEGIELIIENTPEKLNSIGAMDSDYVPWPVLFTGMFFNNVYYWCTNQMIIQKTIAGKNLEEGQKGALLVAVFVIVGALFLVVPGIIAFNMFGDSINPADNAYPTLVATVLPEWAYGLFATVIFGTVLSTFVGALNSTGTLFTLDFYKPLSKKNVTDEQITRAGKIFTIIAGIVAIIIAPVISFAPQGLYALLQEFYGLYSMPLLVIVLMAFYSKKATALSAKLVLIVHVIIYLFSRIAFREIHYLYVVGAMFFIDIFIMWFISKIKPLEKSFDLSTVATAEVSKIDVTPWRYAKLVSIIVIIAMFGMYLVFSPLGIAK